MFLLLKHHYVALQVGKSAPYLTAMANRFSAGSADA